MVGIRTRAGQAKVIGTVLCIGGSMLMTFWKGSLIRVWPSHIHWKYAEEMAAGESPGSSSGSAGSSDTLIGALLVIASCFAYSVWFIIQARMSRTFSAPYTSSTIMCWMSTVQCFIVAAAIERKPSAWALGFDIRLYTVLYIGVIGSGFATSLMSWCIDKRGPLFVSMFNPLLLIIVAVLGWAILDEKLYFGTVIGSVLIVLGLYMVLWGKGKETLQRSVINEGKNVEDENGEHDCENGASAIGLPVYISTGPSAHK